MLGNEFFGRMIESVREFPYLFCQKSVFFGAWFDLFFGYRCLLTAREQMGCGAGSIAYLNEPNDLDKIVPTICDLLALYRSYGFTYLESGRIVTGVSVTGP